MLIRIYEDLCWAKAIKQVKELQHLQAVYIHETCGFFPLFFKILMLRI